MLVDIKLLENINLLNITLKSHLTNKRYNLQVNKRECYKLQFHKNNFASKNNKRHNTWQFEKSLEICGKCKKSQHRQITKNNVFKWTEN